MLDLPRRVKIVCTLGPSTKTREKIESLIQAGMNVARLNFSHGDHAYHSSLFSSVRASAKSLSKNVAVLQDLQGPKLRVSLLPKEGVQFRPGDSAVLYREGEESSLSASRFKRIPVPHEILDVLVKDLRKGGRVLFDDGRIQSQVERVNSSTVEIEVLNSGTLTSRKGINLPGTPVSLPCCTEKDLSDLKLGLSLGVDAVALSFVRSASDIEEVRKRIERQSNCRPLIFAKIEREEAIEDCDEIIEVSDGLLIARGDMAVEIGAGRVPVIQKHLIHACNEIGVPVITATQMLESMVSCSTPTRAEANDVANAVFDGTDGVMLSAETASGDYPVEAVQTMDAIIRRAEESEDRYSVHPKVDPVSGSIVDSIEFSASRIANHVGARAIACITHSGMAARSLSKFRPKTPIVAIMDREDSLRKLSFVWGVNGVMIPKILGTDNIFSMVERVLTAEGWAEQEDLVVVTAGVPTLRRGTTNTVKVHRMGASIEQSGISDLASNKKHLEGFGK